ncbi:hypothetical protein JOM56_012050 [Amanita muscaria]
MSIARCYKVNSTRMIFIIFLVLRYTRQVMASTNFAECYNQLLNRNSTEGVVDGSGWPVTNISDAVGYTYQACLSQCGRGNEPFNWPEFNQQFTAWFLPWLALISQLPYGAHDALSNFEAMLLTVGSPMLAAYSLALTVTSNRWMIKRFRQSNHPRAFSAAKALRNLQQVLLTLPKEDEVLPSLVVLQENDELWEKLDEGLDYEGPRWTLAAIMSIVYVALTYVFTWVSTLQDDLTAQVYANGQSIGSLWLSLLPIVTCYLQISPKSEGDRIRKAVEIANKCLYVATETGEPERVRGIRAITVNTADRDVVYEDQVCTTPIHFYDRVFTWLWAAQQVTDAFEAASISEFKQEKSGKEPRTTADVIEWCTLGDCQDNNQVYEFLSIYVRSALLALFLQWGTTGAAIIALYLTPTRGFGCRSASFLLYGILATVVWVLFVTSSGLAHSYTASKERGRPAKYIGPLVLIFRQLGKTIAAFNTAWIIISSLFQFSNVYDNCYCNASVFGLGSKAYAVLHLVDEDIKLTKLYWASGMIMASGTALVFISTINLLMKQPEPRIRI